MTASRKNWYTVSDRCTSLRDALLGSFRSRGIGLDRRTLDGVVDLLPMDRNFLGGFHAQADFIAANFDDDNLDAIIDHNAFILLPGKHQHGSFLCQTGPAHFRPWERLNATPTLNLIHSTVNRGIVESSKAD